MKSRLFTHFSISNLVRLMIAVALIGQSLLTSSFSHRAAEARGRNADSAIAKEANARAVIDANYGKLPLSFEINRGQADKQVKFLARTGGSSLLLKNNEAVLTLAREEKVKESSKTKKRLAFNDEPTRRITSTIKMKLLNANPSARIVGLEEQQAKSSYFVGNDPKQWTTDVPNYARVKYEQVYPGIDLIFYGNPQKLEYDFVVAPGADPKQIKLSFTGAQKMKMGADGNLVFTTKAGEVRQHKPVIYQEGQQKRQEISGRHLLSGNCVEFEVGAYDVSKPLVIDPVVSYATFLGLHPGTAIAVDAAGNAYVGCGLAATPGAYQGGTELSVTKLNPTGTAVLYSATFGSNQDDRINDLTIDAAGNVYFTGRTKSPNFPTTVGAFQPNFGNSSGNQYNAYVTKLNPAGNALVYSTFLKGEVFSSGSLFKVNEAFGLAVDTNGSAYITGITNTTDFPVTLGAYQTAIRTYVGPRSIPAADVFVAKLNPNGSGLVFSTYLGGSTNTEAGYDIAVDAAGNTYITGSTFSDFVDINLPRGTPFPTTPGAFQTSDTLGNLYVFVTKLNSAGSLLIYSTLLGTSGVSSHPTKIAVDVSGNAYIAGTTRSQTFPTTSGAYQRNGGGPSVVIPGDINEDAFVSKLNSTGSDLVYSTYLGGNYIERCFGLWVDLEGNAHVTGLTTSADFPQIGLPPQTIGIGENGGSFVTKLNAAGSALTQSLFFRQAESLAVTADRSGNVYVAGYARPGFSTTTGVFQTVQPSQAGGGFVIKASSPRSAQSVSAATFAAGALASESIVAAFGTGLATATQIANATPLPTSLAGTTVKVRDSIRCSGKV